MYTEDPIILNKLWCQNPAYTSALKSGRSVRFIPKEIPLFDPVFHEHIKTKYDKQKRSSMKGWHIPQAISAYYPSYANDSKRIPSASVIPPISGTLREEQTNIVNDLLKHRYSYGHISTGVGKTWILCEIITRLQQHTLVVVHSTSALTQMIDDIKNILNIDTYIIWNVSKRNKINLISPIHIINIHSLDKADLNSYWLILYDEADKYLSSENYRSSLCRAESYFSYAVTGTTKVNHYPDNVIDIFYGRKYSLIKKMMTPNYIQINTPFKLASFKDFSHLKELLYTNKERNDFIVATVHKAMATHNKAIIFCEYIDHSETLSERFRDMGYKVFVIIWAIDQDERERIRKEVTDYPGKCILVGSVKILGRGFDCTPLDLWVLTTAEKFDSNIFQYLGRILRQHPWKEKCTFIDFVDKQSGVLANQARTRLKNFNKEFPTLWNQ